MTTNNVLSAFSVDHVSDVTGLSKSRLTRWDKLGFFSPEHLDENDRGNAYARVYSFIDLVGLRTLKILTDEYGVPLSELKKAAAELEKRSSKPWAEIPLGVLKRRVVFDLDTKPKNVTDGQYALKHIKLGLIADQVAKKANKLKSRTPDQIGKIVRHRFVSQNSMVIAGTRIPISVIESLIDAGYSDTAIMEEYDLVKKKDIQAVRRNRKAAA